MEEINNFQQEPDETLYQAWERFKELSMKCPQHCLTEMQEVILFYNGLEVPTRQILDSKGAIPSKTTVDAKERGFGSLPSSTEANPRDQVKLISTTVEADTNPIRHIGSPQYAVSTPQNRRLIFESRQMTIPFLSCLNDYYCDEKKGSYRPQFSEAYSYGASHINNSIPRKEKDPGNFTLPCYINNVCFDNVLADLGASDCEISEGIAENMLVGIGKFVFPVDFIILDMPEDVKVPLILERPFLSTTYAKIDLRERMELDLEARLMGETLVLNRSLDPLYGDYIDMNDLNVPLDLRRDQVDDLIPTIEEGEGVLHSIIKDKVGYRGKNVVRAFMNVPIFVRNFSVITYFAVVENMDGYRDQDMGDIILGEPFCKASCVEARRFDGLITIYNGNDYVTYQMARSHPRFKHLSNAQCNKIKPLLKLMLLVYKLLLLVFRTNVAGTKLQLLTELQLLIDKD
ncbi:hypothetical protein Tco_0684678 [Tanacetum coccineum]